jgi:hypothetical protein
VMRGAIRVAARTSVGVMRSSELIRGHHWSSEVIQVIRGHQRMYLGVMPCMVWVTARASTGAANE